MLPLKSLVSNMDVRRPKTAAAVGAAFPVSSLNERLIRAGGLPIGNSCPGGPRSGVAGYQIKRGICGAFYKYVT